MPDKSSDPTSRIQITFRIPADRHEALKIAAARRHESIQEMLEQGLDLLLDGPSPRRSKGNKENAEERWHSMLDEILRSGVEQAIEITQNNLSKSATLCRTLAK